MAGLIGKNGQLTRCRRRNSSAVIYTITRSVLASVARIGRGVLSSARLVLNLVALLVRSGGYSLRILIPVPVSFARHVAMQFERRIT